MVDSKVAYEQVRPRELSDEETASYHAFWLVVEAETHPDDPPIPVSIFSAQKRSLPGFIDVWCFLARDTAGAVVGAGTALALTTGENPHALQVGVRVLPARRRQGIGRELLRRLVELAEHEGKSLLIGETSDLAPAGAELCRRAGATPGMETHVNRLLLAGLDPGQLRRWVEEGPTRAPGYELVGYDGACSDELAEAVAQVLNVMNDAPRDELRLDDMHFTVSQLRDWERSDEATGNEHWWLLAREVGSDQLAGLTDVTWNAAHPETVFQGNTGVLAAHRGKALGKWLKAAMLERVLAERPGANDVRTSNADSNEAMLGINRQLGFEHYIARTAWQADLEAVRVYLASG
ncbi:MAG: GNAT family N-acetyltransferase [Acidimicrobiales bacterium]